MANPQDILNDYKKVVQTSGMERRNVRKAFFDQYSPTTITLTNGAEMMGNPELGPNFKLGNGNDLKADALSFDIGNGRSMVLPNFGKPVHNVMRDQVRLFGGEAGTQQYATPTIIQGDDYANPLIKGHGVDKLSEVTLPPGWDQPAPHGAQRAATELEFPTPAPKAPSVREPPMSGAEPPAVSPTKPKEPTSTAEPPSVPSPSPEPAPEPESPQPSPAPKPAQNTKSKATTEAASKVQAPSPQVDPGQSAQAPKSSENMSPQEHTSVALDKADKNADDIFNKTISEAIDKGGDVEAAMKSASIQSETNRYHEYAKHAQSLRKDYLENETARAREAKKNGEKYEKQEFFDYAREHQDKLTEGANPEAKKRFSGMLDNMEKARQTNNEQIEKIQGQLKNLEQRKQEFIDDVKPSLRHRVSSKIKNGLGLLRTSVAHPEQAARNISGRLGNTQAFKDLKEAQKAREDAYRQQKGEADYNKKYSAQEKLKRGKLAVLEERNRQINNLSGNAATYYGSEDRGARAGAQRNMRSAAREKAAANSASKAGKGLGLKAKGGMALGLLAIGGILGNMMGGHGEQTNAQLYNPNPQPQYAN